MKRVLILCVWLAGCAVQAEPAGDLATRDSKLITLCDPYVEDDCGTFEAPDGTTWDLWEGLAAFTWFQGCSPLTPVNRWCDMSGTHCWIDPMYCAPLECYLDWQPGAGYLQVCGPGGL